MPITKRTKPLFRLTNSTDITVVRPGTTVLVNGRPQTGPDTTHTIVGNIQPMKYETVLKMPESDRNKEWYTILCDLDQDIRTSREGSGGWEADSILLNGFNYKVMKILQYDMGVLDHKEVQVARTPISAGV